MRAIVLSAGRGPRFLPVSADMPACLVPIGSRSLLQWQLEALDQSRLVDEIVVVIGSGAASVEAAVQSMPAFGARLNLVFDPFHEVAGTLASCWMARRFLTDDLLIVDGRLLFEVAAVSHFLNAADGPATLAVSRRLQMHGAPEEPPQTRDPRDTDSEVAGRRAATAPIGLIQLRSDGAKAFLEEVERRAATKELRDGHMGAVEHLAERGLVKTATLDNLAWERLGSPADFDRACELAVSWERIRIVA